MLSRLGYWSYYALSWIVWILPLRVAYVISDLLYVILYKAIGYRVKVTRDNLKNAFPEKSEKERQEIERRFYHHLCDIFIESMQLIHMRPKEAKERFVFADTDYYHQQFNEGRHIVAVLGHYGNWETNIVFPLFNPNHAIATYKPLNDAYFNSRMIMDRQRFGMEVVSMRETVKKVIERSRGGKPIILALIADQAPMPSETDFWVKFLNQDTAIFMGPEKIAQRLKASVVFINIEKVKRGYYKMTPILLSENAAETEPGEITKLHVRALEDIIKEKPEYWLWSHRRWKRSRPEGTKLQDINE